MFYKVLMEKRAYDGFSGLSFTGPTARYILGGALAGGVAGRKTADEDHKTRDMLLGAVAGGALGAGASRFHKALNAHRMKSQGLRLTSETDEHGDVVRDILSPIDRSKADRHYAGIESAQQVAAGEVGMPKGKGEFRKLREATKRNVDIDIRNHEAKDLDSHSQDVLSIGRDRELLRGQRNLALGAGAGLGLSKLRSRDEKKKRN